MHHIYLTLVKLVHNYRNEGFSGANVFLCFQTDPPEIKLFGGIFSGGAGFGQILRQGITSSLTSLTGSRFFSRSHFSFYTTEVVVVGGIQLGRGAGFGGISWYISVLQFRYTYI